jgi:hypothetical protein
MRAFRQANVKNNPRFNERKMKKTVFVLSPDPAIGNIASGNARGSVEAHL